MPTTVPPWHSLKTRITLANLAIFLTSLWALSLYATQMLHGDMERISGEQQFSTVTANAFADNRARCIEAGMNDFIAKPFVPEGLFAILLKWLERRSDYSNDHRYRKLKQTDDLLLACGC